MTFTEFMTKYNGKYVDFDGVYGPQCVDLCRQYMIEVLQVDNNSIKPVVGAKDMYEKYDTLVDKTIFDRIPNTPEGVPQEGDIILWGNSTYGHVAIFIEGDTNRFKSFDQNYPTGSFCHAQEHTYVNVLGWLRCKKQSTQVELEKCVADRNRNWDYFIGLCDALQVAHDYNTAKIEIKALQDESDLLEKTIKERDAAIAHTGELESTITSGQQVIKELQEKNTQLQIQLDDSVNKVDTLSYKYAAVLEALQKLKASQNVQPTLLEKIFNALFRR